MTHSDLTKVLQAILSDHRIPSGSDNFPEDFAYKRFLKKFELPDESRSSERATACFEVWSSTDSSLRVPPLWPYRWAKAKLFLRELCKDFRLAPLVFTNGSEAHPTRGFNSIESKLMRSRWECTPNCFDLWCASAYQVMAIKRCARLRFQVAMKHDRKAIKAFHRESWERYKGCRDRKFLCFKRLLSRVTLIRDASRFTTVPKNNDRDRPVVVEPLCNMLVQRRIGNAFRALLKSRGWDLDRMQDLHRERIRDKGVATLDLRDASDSIHLSLVKYLLPSFVFELISQARSPFVEAPNGDYWYPNKVSSMGNGFTFELMSTILLSICLVHDAKATVFGDDIIVANAAAPGVIEDLEGAGFVVNAEKSFVNSEFRESCGANWHDSFGYVESFDFRYPKDIGEVIVFANKLYKLRHYEAFRALHDRLMAAVPQSMQGPPPTVTTVVGRGTKLDLSGLDLYFWSNQEANPCRDPRVMRVMRDYQVQGGVYHISGVRFSPLLASETRTVLDPRYHCAKYLMYLNAGCAVDDTVEGLGRWNACAYIWFEGKTQKVSSLRQLSRLSNVVTACAESTKGEDSSG